MNKVDMNQMLNQMRINAALAQNKPASDLEKVAGQGDFSTLLKQSIDKVNQLQSESGKLGESFELGDPKVSLAQVMIAKEKAGVAFQAVLQVRNKLVEAYKEVMSMQV